MEEVKRVVISDDKNRKEISTLECPNLTHYRRDGNTTRQINFAIEQLFSGHIVKVEDHYNNGKTLAANQDLYKRIQDRLFIEFKVQYKYENNIVFDRENYIIKFTKSF